MPLFLADCATAARAGGLGGERSDTRAREVVEFGSLWDTTGLGKGDASGGGEETARMPFFFWRTLAMLVDAFWKSGRLAAALYCLKDHHTDSWNLAFALSSLSARRVGVEVGSDTAVPLQSGSLKLLVAAAVSSLAWSYI